MLSWLLVLVVLMASGRDGGRRRRSSAQQPVEEPAEEGSEYNPSDDSGGESQEEAYESARIETRSKRKEQGKGKGKEKEKEKGKEPAIPTEEHTFIRGRRRTGGISFYEHCDVLPPREAPAPVDSKRQRMYASKQCVGERAVGVTSLFDKVLGFQALYEIGNLREICDFLETAGYGIELIREFYMKAGNLLEAEGGPYAFSASVRGMDLMITPEVIGNVLEMPAWTGGVDYLNDGFDPANDWTRILRSICVDGAENDGSAILSKDLRLEYRFLNFVVCYNIMPLANTKVIRWDRVLYMYLLGRPNIIQERNINLNIPFLIWKRMTREIKTASQKDRLPFPLLIMRILRLHNVNVTCSSYERSLGPISDATLAKSHVQLHGHASPVAEPHAPASPPAHGSPPMAGSKASISSVYREQQRLSGKLERFAAVQIEIQADVAKLNKKYGRISRFLRLICGKLGCGSSKMPPPGSDLE